MNFNSRFLFSILLSLQFLAVGLFAAPATQPQPTSAPAISASDVVDWSTQDGMQRLARSTAKKDFFKLVNYYESQPNKFLCGPTTATIVLNAFRIGKPEAPQDRKAYDWSAEKYLPKDFDPLFHKYTQNTFYTQQTDAIKTKMQILGEPINGKPDFGLSLDQFKATLEAHGLKVEAHHVDNANALAEIRKVFAKNVATDGDFVIVNYARKSLNQVGGGHISPLGAYDQKSDSFLILDVNPNTAPFVWVKASALVAAMNTGDGDKFRGYLLVSDPTQAKK